LDGFLVVWLVGSLFGWFVGCVVVWMIVWLIGSFTPSFDSEVQAAISSETFAPSDSLTL